MKEYLDFGIELAIEAGTIIKAASMQQRQVAATKENHADLVTKTDKQVEEFLFGRIQERYPDHVLVGEESAQEKISVLSAKPTWIIDPIDGTTNFVHNFPFFCVSIGLCIGGEPVIGVVLNPILMQLFYASKGNGSFLCQSSSFETLLEGAIRLGRNTTPLPPSLSQALLATEYGASKGAEHLNPKLEMVKSFITTPVAGRGIRSIGTAALSMCLTAQGIVDVYYESGVHAWDVCAGAVIVKEAGGIVRGWNQKEFDVLDRSAICIRPGSGDHNESPAILEELLSILVPINYPRD